MSSLRRAAPALVVAALLVVVSAPVIADVGDPVLQGRFNQVDRKTTLAGSVSGDAMLKVANLAADGTGLNIQVERGNPPMKVNTQKKVKKLNADRLDGLSSEDFLHDEGVILVSVSDSGWRPLDSDDPVSFNWSGNTNLDISRSVTGTNWFNNDGDIPTVLFGRSVQFNGVEFCYDATDPNVSFSAIQINVTTDSNGEPTWFTPILEQIARDDASCRVYIVADPAILTAENSLQVWIQANWTGIGTFEMGRLTMIFELTDLPAAAPAGPALPAPAGQSTRSPAGTD